MSCSYRTNNEAVRSVPTPAKTGTRAKGSRRFGDYHVASWPVLRQFARLTCPFVALVTKNVTIHRRQGEMSWSVVATADYCSSECHLGERTVHT